MGGCGRSGDERTAISTLCERRKRARYAPAWRPARPSKTTSPRPRKGFGEGFLTSPNARIDFGPRNRRAIGRNATPLKLSKLRRNLGVAAKDFDNDVRVEQDPAQRPIWPVLYRVAGVSRALAWTASRLDLATTLDPSQASLLVVVPPCPKARSMASAPDLEIVRPCRRASERSRACVASPRNNCVRTMRCIYIAAAQASSGRVRTSEAVMVAQPFVYVCACDAPLCHALHCSPFGAYLLIARPRNRLLPVRPSSVLA